MPVTSTQDQRVDVLACPVFEVRCVAINVGQQRDLCPIVWPVIAHGSRTVANSDRLCAVFPALRADVFGRITGANNQNVFVFEFHRVAEIMGVQNTSLEAVEAVKLRDIWRAKVARANDHMIKAFGVGVVVRQITDCDVELVTLLFNPADGSLKLDPITHTCLVDTALDVIK